MSISNKYSTTKPKVLLIRYSSLRVSSNKFFFFTFSRYCCCFFTHHTQNSLLDAISPLTYIYVYIYFPQKITIPATPAARYGQKFFSHSLFTLLEKRQLQQQIWMKFIQGHEAAIFIFPFSCDIFSFETFFFETFPFWMK